MNIWLSIAAGGALGACTRYATTHMITRMMGVGFPYGTVAVNIVGSLFMGVVIGLLARYAEGQEPWRSFLVIGFLGSYTTFSSFSLDAIALIQRGELLAGGGYIFISVLGSLFALLLGLALVKAVL